MLIRSFGMPSRKDEPPSIWDTHVFFGKRFCKSSRVFFSTLSAGVESMELRNIRTDSLINGGDEWESNTSSRSEMPVWTVSQKFSLPLWGRLLKEFGCRPTTPADFGSSLWQIPHASNVRLLEDKIQDWGMYLFTISFGSYAVDQRCGDGSFSGWFKVIEKIEWSHNPHVSPATIHHTEAVFSIIRKIYEREPDDLLDDLDVNMVIWGIFLNTTLQAAVHLGQDYEANSRYVKNRFWIVWDSCSMKLENWSVNKKKSLL